MTMSNDSRVSVQSSCPHGVFPDGARRWLLVQNRAGFGLIQTNFDARRDITLHEAVWQIEGRTPFPHELERDWWKLERVVRPATCLVGVSLRDLVEWRGPQQTSGVCDLCAIDEVKKGWGSGS